MYSREEKLNYLNSLNANQIEALVKIEEPVCILAGAGTGKTRVLTYKIFHLIETASYPIENILAVTFTNKAAIEMKYRVKSLLSHFKNDSTPIKWVRTFHSTCLSILIEHSSLVGLKENFSIYDTEDSHKLVRQLIKLDSQLRNLDIKVSEFCSKISFYKNRFLFPKDIYQLAEENSNASFYHLARIYEKYEEHLLFNNAVDFDNLILKVLELFKKHPSVLEYYQNFFKYVLVDEFQDINNVQYEFVKLLTQKNKKITVVGDDDQSIYSWRGANVSHMNSFLKDYPNAIVVKLEKNYRSPNILLKAANSLIKNNHNRMGKELWSDSLVDEPIIYYQAYDIYKEAAWIALKILELRENENVSFNDIAILYRVNSQSRVIEEALRKKTIPYKVHGTLQFYDRLEIKDVLAFFSYLVNHSNEIALKRILKILNFGVGTRTIEKLDQVKNEKNSSFEESIYYGIHNNLFRGNIKKRLEDFLIFLEDLKTINLNWVLVDILDAVFQKTNYLEHLQLYEDYETRLENIEEFRKSLLNYQSNQEDEVSLTHYMRDIMLSQEEQSNKNEEESSFVSLMTLHHSKGLEFHYVFLTGLVQGILPHHRTNNSSIEDLYEERRLFYVGITRTIRKCFMTSFLRERNGFNDRFYSESIFLIEIDDVYIERLESIEKNNNYSMSMVSEQENNIYRAFQNKNSWIKNHIKKKEVDKKLDDPTLKRIEKISEISVGVMVYHKEFGYCKILAIDETKTGTTIHVNLEKDKTKLILLFKYANLYVKN